jgi:periplasmic glucans biosynthesis protein
MHRRNFIKLASTLCLATAMSRNGWAQAGSGGAPSGEGTPFSEQWLLTQAQNMARAPFEVPKLQLPAELEDLNSQQYQDIRFRQENTPWYSEDVPFKPQFFQTGFQYKTPVEISLIDGGVARPLPYSTSMFEYGPQLKAPPADSQSGFSGFKVVGPINRAAAWDEFLSFQGASYFRAMATGQMYGASSRGIAINTAQPAGEEFPVFRSFWIQKPAQGDRQVTIYALLDGPSLTGAYRFRAEPGRSTVLDVEMTLFPRKVLTHVGLAPLTSMYFFGAADPTRQDDIRPNVHSSTGLLIWNGQGQWLWRPLINPERIQYSAFSDRSPKGFGLMQREREFADYQDIDNRFGDRPSLWVEPVGDWGEGTVDLIELPTRSEIYDNVVAFWRPKTPLAEIASHHFRYRLHWCWEPPVRSTQAYTAQTRVGALGRPEARQFVVDFVSGSSCNGCNVTPFTADVRAGGGEVRNVTVRQVPATGAQRVTFEYRPGRTEQTDIRCELLQNGQAISEIWVYRWTT